MCRLLKCFCPSLIQDHARKLAAVKPELMSRFCQLQDEARELRVDCGLKACKELFVFLCGVGGLDDDSMQLNYDCLSLIQIFMKQEEGGEGAAATAAATS